MKKIIALFCVTLSVFLCACSGTSQKEDQGSKYQGTWVYDKYSNSMGSVKDILTIDGEKANYTRETTFMGGKNTTTYANYEFKIQDGVATLSYIEGHGISVEKWELTLSENELIADSKEETVYFEKQ
ncbi:MAG: hypothetical protein E7561_00945 [Ruminococcaceae bacterium]|nr:hypothetical protein [Oscillospiraceae bacterium]